MIALLLVASGAVYSVYSAREKTQRKALQEIAPQPISPAEADSSMPTNTENDAKVLLHNPEPEREAKHYLQVAAASLGFAIGGLVYAPLTLGAACCLVYMTIPFWKNAYASLMEEKRINMAVLDSVVLPSYVLFHFYIAGSLAHLLYFYSRKVLVKTEDHTRQNLINVFGEQPRSVWILKDSVEIEIPFEELDNNCLVIVRTGETIPIDGIIEQGIASIDQHILTGESQPVEKTTGDDVFASTVILSGSLHIKVSKTGRATVAAQIGEILLKTADFKSSIQSSGERLADSSAVPTLLLGAVALSTVGASGAIAILNASFGYSVRVFAPISLLNYLNIASHNGILVKDGRSLDLLTKVDTVVFDKTGTLTLEQPHVGGVYLCNGFSEKTLLQAAAAAEYKQTHPIARAILAEAEARELALEEIQNAKYEVGYGIKVQLSSEQLIRVGSIRFMQLEGIDIPKQIHAAIQSAHEEGHSLVLVAINEQLAGVIELHATIRPEIKKVIQDLHALGLSICIISGDNEKPTKNLAQKLGIDSYFAEALPEDKAKHIEALQAEGKQVCFIGDGINDSIALKKANVSISMRGASSIATDTAQVVLMDKTLEKIPDLFKVAKELEQNMKRGFALTIIPGAICVGGVFFLGFGVLSSILLFNLGLIAGVSNSMQPVTQKFLNRKLL
ncbi:MAG: heavy metal translocating P-type ATPase [Pseudomonadota bacterium]